MCMVVIHGRCESAGTSHDGTGATTERCRCLSSGDLTVYPRLLPQLRHRFTSRAHLCLFLHLLVADTTVVETGDIVQQTTWHTTPIQSPSHYQ